MEEKSQLQDISAFPPIIEQKKEHDKYRNLKRKYKALKDVPLL